MASTLFTSALILLLAASVAGGLPPLRARRAELLLSATASVLALSAALATSVFDGGAVSLDLWSPSPYAELSLRMDALSTVFVAIIGGTGVAASIFGLGYAQPRLVDAIAYPAFLLAMLLTVTAANVYTFLLGWEGMAVTSFLLVLGDGAASTRRRAAILYLGMTHVMTVFAVAALFIVANAAGSNSFEAMSDVSLTRGQASLVFLLALCGFGTKAGLIPFHIWLPRAHPVAPSHVSALMSAAMVKIGIYGLARVTLAFLPAGEVWWGLLLMGAGGVSAVLGILYALMEHDLKRMLAYSTVENVGIIAIGLGTALALRAAGHDALSAAALTASLLHTTNHALFKTLLFLAAGSVQRATHTLSIDRCGGLARVMPFMGAAVLIGCLSISALPPFNGFAGEWLLLRTLLDAGSQTDNDSIQLISVAMIAALALTGGLAVACFVRLFGIAFLGLPRTEEAAAAREQSPLMSGVLIVLAAGCLVTGLAAGWLSRWLQAVPESLLSVDAISQSNEKIALAGGGSFSPVLIAAVLILLAPVPWLAARVLFGQSRRQTSRVWATGIVFRPMMQYTGISFSKILRLFFHRILLPEREIDVVYHGASPLPRLVRYSGRVPVLFEERLYLPLRAAVFWGAGRVRLIQNGSVQAYLLYVMAALALLLVVFR